MSNLVAEARRLAETNPELAKAAQDTMQEMLSRSATDLEFRRKLLGDPRAAIREFTGREVPESFNVTFVENTADATIVLPDAIDPAAELSETELETVAGGTSDPLSVVISVAGVITTVVMIYNAMQEHNKDTSQ